MLPKGLIWQQLRQRSLVAIPAGVPYVPGNPQGLRHWADKGAYTVSSASLSVATIDASQAELGSALLSDAEQLLDHAAEHQCVLHRECVSEQKGSPAWTLVTVYYWALFNAIALTRLLGRTVWYVDPVTAKRFAALAPGGSGPSGNVRLELAPPQASSRVSVCLHRSQVRFHESTWRQLAAAVDDVSQGPSKTEEALLYEALRNVGKKLSHEWPSRLRNLVNYRPGHGYRLVRKDSRLDIQKYARQRANLPLGEASAQFAYHLGFLTRATMQEVSSQGHAGRLLVDLAFLLAAMARDLHAEIVERRGLPNISRTRRQAYLREAAVLDGPVEWPLGPTKD